MIGILRLQARRDRLQLTIWIAALVLLTASSTAAVRTEFGDPGPRAGLVRVALATPSLLALRGVPDGSSLGSLMWFQLYAFLAVVVGLMNGFLATRHGRGDEERGRRELLAATPIERTTPLVATLLLGVAANVVLGTLLGLAFVVSGLPGDGAATAGATLAVTGLAFLGVALLVGELTPTGRSANGITTGLVLLAYALRGAGDALGEPDLSRLTLRASWPSWLSPIGWGEQTFAFTGNRLAPLLLHLALFAAAGGAAVALRSRRDLGASLLRERPGRATAHAALRGPTGLLARLAWPAVTAWVVGSALLGIIVGPLVDAVRQALEANPSIGLVLSSLGHSSVDATGLFVTAVMSMVGMLAAAAAMQTTLRLREEEATGHAELLLSAPVRRPAWLAAAVAGGWAAAVLVLALSAAATWLGLLAVGERAGAAQALAQAAAELPAALVFAGIAALLAAALPRFAIGLSWGVFTLAAALALFGALLKVPDVVQHASPFSDVPEVPVGDWLSTSVLAVVAVALPVLGGVALARRDISA